MKRVTLLAIVVVCLAIFVLGINFTKTANTITANTILDDKKMEGVQQVLMQTSKGDIYIDIYTEKTPITAKNFLDLASQHFYDGLTFHRYVPGFVIQGGDPRGDGTGGSGKTIPLEIAPDLKHEKGVIAMARSNDPNSASSQFYFTLDAAPHLDGSYAVFGKVTKGMDVVMQLRKGDVIKKVTLLQ